MSPRVGAGSRGDEAWNVLPSNPHFSQSLERGLAILGCFTLGRPVLGVAEVADQLGMRRATVYRYMSTLVALGFLERGAGRRYKLSLRVTRLGMSAVSSTDLGVLVRPYLEVLRRRTSYTASLGMLDGPELVCVDCAVGSRRGLQMADLDFRPGSRLPAYCTSIGKVLLANLPESEQRGLVENMTFVSRGPGSIVSREALRVELGRVLEEGMAVEDEELSVGLVSIAAPVRDESRGVVAGVGLVARTSMISVEELADQLQSHLFAAADDISARLGYRRDDEVIRWDSL